jgi:hypothetical protein
MLGSIKLGTLLCLLLGGIIEKQNSDFGLLRDEVRILICDDPAEQKTS